jgi:hypothetical protein
MCLVTRAQNCGTLEDDIMNVNILGQTDCDLTMKAISASLRDIAHIRNTEANPMNPIIDDCVSNRLSIIRRLASPHITSSLVVSQSRATSDAFIVYAWYAEYSLRDLIECARQCIPISHYHIWVPNRENYECHGEEKDYPQRHQIRDVFCRSRQSSRLMRFN